MRILFLAHRLPYPPNKGDKIRSYHELAYLAERHEVWCATFVDRPEDWGHVEALRPLCREMAAIPLPPRQALMRGAAGLLRGGTLTEAYYQSRDMHRLLDQWTCRTKFDAVLVYSSSMAAYGLSVPASRHVVDFCDLDSAKWAQYAKSAGGIRGWLYGLESRRLARREVEWAERYDKTVLITEQEARPLLQRVDSDKVLVVGNGVGSELFETDATLPSKPVVGFVGAMDYRPNIDAVEWFCRQIWPNVRGSEPQAVFRILGRSPTPHVEALAAVPGVEVIGPVDDVRPEVGEFCVSVAPLRLGRGLQNKVLEAMALARPVVLTGLAASGIDAVDNEDYLVADSPEDFAARIVYLLRDREAAQEIGVRGRRFVAENHDWPREMGKLEEALTGEPEGVMRTAKRPSIPMEVPV